MDQPLDARLELDEGTIVGEAHDFSLDTRLAWVLLVNGFPWIEAALLEAQRDAFFLGVELEHDDLDLVTHVEHLAGVIDASPGHVRLVQKTVDSAQIDKGTVLGDVLHNPPDHFPFGEAAEGATFLLGVLLLKDRLP